MKRFTDTEIWDEDWFVNLPNKYKLFWFYIKDKCDNAGIWRPNISNFQKSINEPITIQEFLLHANSDPEDIKILVLDNKKWFLKKFFTFQYGTLFKLQSPVHRGALKQLVNNGIHLTELPNLETGKLQVVDFDSLKEIAYNKDIGTLLLEYGYSTNRAKDKDKNKDKTKDKNKNLFGKSENLFFGEVPDDLMELAQNLEVMEQADEWHDYVQSEIEKLGYTTKREVEIFYGDNQRGRLDLVAYSGDIEIAIELDRRTPRKKSIEKVKSYKCGMVLLREPKVNQITDAEIVDDIHPETLIEKMLKEWEIIHPHYLIEKEKDFTACWQIALKIGQQKNWEQNELVNGKMADVIKEWKSYIVFIQTDKFYSNLQLVRLNTEWQGLVIKKNKTAGGGDSSGGHNTGISGDDVYNNMQT